MTTKPLPLSQTESGSLATAPLTTLLNSSTDSLYQDFFDLVHGTVSLPTDSSTDPPETSGRMRMSALSFSQRRHELSRRLTLHCRSISHVYAVAACSLGPGPRLGPCVTRASDALEYVRKTWGAMDEAQDALYFHHDGLWRSRGHAWDVLGACEVVLGGRWGDFPTDVGLRVDPYEGSREKRYGREELGRRLASAVRRKLVLGEVGRFGFGREGLPWKVILEPGGGAVKLVYGVPRVASTVEAVTKQSLAEAGQYRDGDAERDSLQEYPMEACLSVLSESVDAPWKLLSIRVRCEPKTGESDHQLQMNKKQMFDLHRIGERVMIVEEAIRRKAEENDEELGETKSTILVARPLLRLFEVTHSFALSLQLEMLSSQAEALRRGAWGGVGYTRKDSIGDGIVVSPAHFSDELCEGFPVAVMAVHFWSCDDRFGSPKVGDLYVPDRGDDVLEESEANTNTSSSASFFPSKTDRRVDDNYLPMSDGRGEKRLSLVIRTVPMIGLVVSLSGGTDIMSSLPSSGAKQVEATPHHNHHIRRNVDKLLSSIQDPFQMSMSDALLAATVLCAERRCRSMVEALNSQRTHKIPSWIHLEVECGSISISALLTYPTTTDDESHHRRPYVILFRLACDSRTGQFIPVFPRPSSLLRLLAVNDPSASDVQSLRAAAIAEASGATGRNSKVEAVKEGTGHSISVNDPSEKGSQSLPAKKTVKGRIMRDVFSKEEAFKEGTGRIVRDAFDALSRAMDTLGQKCGVGGRWNDVDKELALLREKSVDQACHDARALLMTCSGMAAVFGVAAVALKVVGGVDPAADIAGGPIEEASDPGLLRIPPLGVLLRQQMGEKIVIGGDGESRRRSQIEGEVFAVTARISEDGLELVCCDVMTTLESASSVPKRLKYAKVAPQERIDSTTLNTSSPPLKRQRTATPPVINSVSCHHILEEAKYAIGWLDPILRP